MDFAYESAFHGVLPEAYERLLLDVLRGDTTLFTRSDELEAAWRFVTPVLDYWEQKQTSRNPTRQARGAPKRPKLCWPVRAAAGAYRRVGREHLLAFYKLRCWSNSRRQNC